MASETTQLPTELQQWLHTHGCRPSEALKQLCNTSLELVDGSMLTSPEQLQFLAFLASTIGAKQAIDVGVFTGASALAVAEVLPDDGKLIACDLTDQYAQYALPAWIEAGVEHKIDFRVAQAIDTLRSLLQTGGAKAYDFMYIDADKTNSAHYYELGLQLLRPGGIIAIDNMFYGGQVADNTFSDPNTVAMRELAAFLVSDHRIQYALIPIGDGLAVATIRD
ncbi:MAG: class I SAM-dependent methyltransferase [Phycisphaerales bacterium]|nr:class I SAM-dependent methyltransferase [Phycisphaerales bacterium]